MQLPAEAAQTTSTPPATGEEEGPRFRVVRDLSQRTVFWVSLLDVVLVVVFTFWSQDRVFLTAQNFKVMALDGSELALLAIGSAFLLAAAQFDISLGANLILSSVVGARVLIAFSGGDALAANGEFPHLTRGIVLGVIATIAAGTVIGIVNGIVVSRLRVNAFVATLGMLGVATGLGDLLAGGTDISNLPTQIQEQFGTATFVGIPDPVWVSGAFVIVLWFVLAYRRFGLRALAIGSSRNAAVRAGLPVARQEVQLFGLAGLLAGVAAVLDLTRFDTTNIGGHQTDALAAIAAAVIGGASLRGGRASVFGAAIGVALAVILQDGLQIVDVSAFYQLIAIGVILVVAVYIDQRQAQLS